MTSDSGSTDGGRQGSDISISRGLTSSHIRSHRLMMRSYPALVLVAARERKSSSWACALLGSVLASASRRAISATVSGDGVAVGLDQGNKERDRRMHGCGHGMEFLDGGIKGERVHGSGRVLCTVEKERRW